MAKKEPHSLASLTATGRGLLQSTSDATGTHSNFRRWDSDVAEWLDECFPNTGLSAQWSSVSGSPLVRGRCYYDDEISWEEFTLAVQCRLRFLASIGARMQSQMQSSASDRRSVITKDVFLVHGHDEAAREMVARFIEKLGLKAIILHEQPSRGGTIIEKLEAHSSVGFAVVLLTPDDTGGKANTEDMRPRARQNVILELGFFCGALGRSRVCALHKGNVEIPSDFDGVVYVPLDDGGAWRPQVAREMKAAGFDVDINEAM